MLLIIFINDSSDPNNLSKFTVLVVRHLQQKKQGTQTKIQQFSEHFSVCTRIKLILCASCMCRVIWRVENSIKIICVCC